MRCLQRRIYTEEHLLNIELSQDCNPHIIRAQNKVVVVAIRINQGMDKAVVARLDYTPVLLFGTA